MDDNQKQRDEIEADASIASETGVKQATDPSDETQQPASSQCLQTLREAVDSGEYQIVAVQVAQAMMQRLLSNRQRPSG